MATEGHGSTQIGPLNAKELREAMQIDEAAFKKLLAAGMPCERVGRKRVFEPSAVTAWLLKTGRAEQRHTAKTITEVAAWFRVDVRTVHNWRNNGMPSAEPFDLDAIDAWRKSRGSAKPDEDAAAARKAEAQAKIQEAKWGQIEGKLVELESVRRLFVRHVTEAGTILDQIPMQVLAELPAECPTADGWTALRGSLRIAVERTIAASRQTLADMLTAREVRPAEDH